MKKIAERLFVHTSPRDRFDWRLNALVIALSFLLIPLLFLLMLVGPAAVMIVSNALLVWGIAKLCRITLLRIEATDEGLQSVRLLGRGRLVRWDEIESVEEMDRGTYLRESLRCLWTNNLAPPSATFSGVWRIRLKSGQFWLIPPSDPALFQRAVVANLRVKEPPVRQYSMSETEETTAKLAAQWWR